MTARMLVKVAWYRQTVREVVALEAENERLKQLVRDAHGFGFSEGCDQIIGERDAEESQGWCEADTCDFYVHGLDEAAAEVAHAEHVQALIDGAA